MPYIPLRFTRGGNEGDSSSPGTTEIQLTFPSFSKCINNSIILEAELPSEFLAANPIRAYALIQNNGYCDITLTLGTENYCYFGQGIILNPRGTYEIISTNLYTGALSAIAEFNCELSYVECIK